jgi:haloacetate dehalogenase
LLRTTAVHQLCVDFSARVTRAVLLDICPTLAMYRHTDQLFATSYWHWFFLVQPAPFPETLVRAAPRLFLEKFLLASAQKDDGGQGQSARILEERYDPIAVAVYEAQLADPLAVHAMCKDYRAAATVDLDEARSDLEKGKRFKCPLRAYWGRKGVVGICFGALKEWRAVSDAEVEGEALDCGHWIPEEVLELVVERIEEFLL